MAELNATQYRSGHPWLVEEPALLTAASLSEVQGELQVLHHFVVPEVAERREMLRAIASELQAQELTLAEKITFETGKVLREARAEVRKCAQCAREFAELPLPSPVVAEPYRVHLAPLGVILALMPWNYPLWQVMRVLAPQILMGNRVLLKPSEIAPVVSELFCALVNNVTAGNWITSVRVPRDLVPLVINDPRVAGVTFTGSTEVGRQIAAMAGQALKKSVLELGGSDPYFVFADADLPLAAQKIAEGRLLNNGQSCIAVKRVFVQAEVAADFNRLLISEFSRWKFDDPRLSHALRGPLSSASAAAHFQTQQQALANSSAQRLWQEDLPVDLRRGVVPSSVWQVSRDHEFMQAHEIFGPALLLTTFEKDEDVFSDRHELCLGAGLFTENDQRWEQFCAQMPNPLLVRNDYNKSSPLVPFGGRGSSGYGRELGVLGLLEFAHIQTCLVAKSRS